MAENGQIRIALAGNPNCGKTTMFNNITGAKQHVGNYAGVTVEKKEGHTNFDGQELLFIDLPGTYSLTARSLDELVARNVIVNDNPDVIVNVLDASNLERNLYLAAQLLELEKPMVIALNMSDVAEEMGYSKPSVSRAVGILKKNGYIIMDGSGHLYLTDEGRSVAEKTFERHRVLTKVFTKLGVSAGIAAEDACKIEHVISDETFEAIKRFVAEHSD